MEDTYSNCACLPSHGPISCRLCFNDSDQKSNLGKWQVINDPGAWGSPTPRILILGFSKGFTQANAYRSGRFEDIPFKDMRTRLTEALRILGVLGHHETVDEKMVSGEEDFAFGSLVRCSLSRLNGKGVLECTGQVMPKVFQEEISSVLRRCAEKFLLILPDTLRLVLMLGTTDKYIEGCRAIIQSLHGPKFSDINAVSYRSGQTVWTHISHPSRLNGHHNKWIAGNQNSKSGRKRHLAAEAIALSGVMLKD